MKRPARPFPSLLLALPACVALAPAACSRGGGERSAAASADAAAAPLPAPGAETRGAAPVEPVCRLVRAPAPVSPATVHASAPALGWGPGVLGLSYVHDEGHRALVRLERFLDGAPHGVAAELGEGAARAPTNLVWSGSSFVLAWNEPSELVGEVFVGMVD
ncbi:MAG: hypothetical protein JXB32_08485, partial [Deltaproteobacteria bacterium]|nr:hypothetical protein [Deltaproteobacteria bacterium]